MGILFVLLFWAAVGLVLASVGATLFGGGAAFLTRGAQAKGKRLILAAALFPFLCLVWAGAVFVLQAAVNEFVLHRDIGLGDTWTCPLPDGYAVLMIDTTDDGWVYNPKTQSGDGVGEQDDAVAGVRTLQIAGRYILAGFDTKDFGHPENSSGAVDSYFVLDTQLGKHTDFPSYAAFRDRAKQLGVTPQLESIDTVYSRYRFTWFDVLAGLLLIVPPIIGTAWLSTWTIRVRRSRGAYQRPA